MISDLRNCLSYNLQSAIGRKIRSRFVVFESDDWGSISIPSKEAYARLEKAGLPLENNYFNKYDNLASRVDIEELSATLMKFRDIKGNHPVFTINVTTGNPDFKSIRENEFTEYVFEPFYRTIEQKQPDAINACDLAIEKKIFFPQYHGRDHVHVERWMNALKANDSYMHKAFDEEAFGIKPENDSGEYYLAAYDYISSNNLAGQIKSIDEGIKVFKDFFGFLPKSFIPPCYICNLEILKHLRDLGVVGFQGKIIHLLPNGIKNNKRTYKKFLRLPGYNRTTGMANLIRNVFFEPSSDQFFDWTGNALKRIEIAFRWGKPAIISSHRVNYIGSHYEQNRNDSLFKLQSLLKKILINWPDVEFINSQELVGHYLQDI